MPLYVRNPSRVSLKWIAAVRQQFRIPVMVFQRTSISPIPRKSPFPFEIRKTVYQAHSFARLSSQKAAWVRPTTISHFEGSYDSSRVDAHIQARRCFAFIPDGLPALFRYRWQTALDTSSSSGTDLSTGNGYSAANMLLPGGGRDLRYSSTFSSVIFAMVTRAEGGGGLFGLTILPSHPDPCLLYEGGF